MSKTFLEQIFGKWKEDPFVIVDQSYRNLEKLNDGYAIKYSPRIEEGIRITLDKRLIIEEFLDSGGDIKSNVTLDVVGQICANGSIRINGDLRAHYNWESKQAILLESPGHLSAEEDVIVYGDLFTDGHLDVKGNVIVEGDLEAKSYIKVGGNLIVKGDCEVGGDITIGKNMEIGGSLKTFERVPWLGSEGNLSVDGFVLIKGNVTLNGKFLKGNLTKQKDVGIKGNLKESKKR